MTAWPDILRAVAAGLHAPERAAELVELAGLPRGQAYAAARNFSIEVVAREASEILNVWSSRTRCNGDGLQRVEIILDGEIIAMPPSVSSGLIERAASVHVRIQECLGGRADVVLTLIGILARKGASSHVEGDVCSGGLMLAACVPGKRTVSPGSKLVLHDVAALSFGDSAALRRRADSLDEIRNRMVEVLTRRTGQSRVTVEEWLRPGTDTFFSPEAALEAGLCDSIGAA